MPICEECKTEMVTYGSCREGELWTCFPCGRGRVLPHGTYAAEHGVERTLSKSSEAIPGVVDEIEELWAGE